MTAVQHFHVHAFRCMLLTSLEIKNLSINISLYILAIFQINTCFVKHMMGEVNDHEE